MLWIPHIRQVASYSQSRALSHQSSTDNKNIVSSAFQYPNVYVGHKLFLCLLFHSPNQACLTFLSFLSKIWGQTNRNAPRLHCAVVDCSSLLTHFMLKPISLHTHPVHKQQNRVLAATYWVVGWVLISPPQFSKSTLIGLLFSNILLC